MEEIRAGRIPPERVRGFPDIEERNLRPGRDFGEDFGLPFAHATDQRADIARFNQALAGPYRRVDRGRGGEQYIEARALCAHRRSELGVGEQRAETGGIADEVVDRRLDEGRAGFGRKDRADADGGGNIGLGKGWRGKARRGERGGAGQEIAPVDRGHCCGSRMESEGRGRGSVGTLYSARTA